MDQKKNKPRISRFQGFEILGFEILGWIHTDTHTDTQVFLQASSTCACDGSRFQGFEILGLEILGWIHTDRQTHRHPDTQTHRRERDPAYHIVTASFQRR